MENFEKRQKIFTWTGETRRFTTAFPRNIMKIRNKLPTIASNITVVICTNMKKICECKAIAKALAIWSEKKKEIENFYTTAQLLLLFKLKMLLDNFALLKSWKC